MSESEIFTDDTRLRSLANEIRLFANTLKAELVSMDEAIGHLGNTWRDGEFEKFRMAHHKISSTLEKLTSEFIRHEPQLNADADRLAHYLNHQQP